jgi:hypothetical protein
MDSGGSAAHAVSSPAGPLEELEKRSGVPFPNLEAARRHTAERLAEEAHVFNDMAASGSMSVVLFGSWARRELTSESDHDWAVLTRGVHPFDPDVKSLVRRCEKRYTEEGKAPGAQGVFGCAFAMEELVEFVGLDSDTNTNLTRRMLLLLESEPVAEGCYEDSRARVLQAYLDHGLKEHRPPRFLLNDVIRYWRTMCVDFEGKHWGGDANLVKWVTRNAKLRTSRKLLFASGLIPVLMCHRHEASEIPAFLGRQFSVPAIDRLSAAFLDYGAIDEGARTMLAYDRWIDLISRAEVRRELQELTEETRRSSALFAQIKDIGDDLDRGLIALMFETGLAGVARKYAIL